MTEHIKMNYLELGQEFQNLPFLLFPTLQMAVLSAQFWWKFLKSGIVFSRYGDFTDDVITDQ